MIYKTSYFRDNIKEALDAAIAGEEVVVERNGQFFDIVYAGPPPKRTYADVPHVPSVPILPGQMTVDEAITSMETVAPAEDWKVAGKGEDSEERLCCSKSKPCQHWTWSHDISAWQNTLSGRTREVEV